VPAATQLVRVPSLDLDIEVLAGDSVIGPSIARGAWAEHETRLFTAHLRPGDVVADLGANIGWFAVHAVLAGCEVHAFEPVPEIAEVCERNVARAQARSAAGTRGRATVHRLAAGAARGRATIALGAANFGDNRVLEDGRARPDDMGAGRAVEIEVAPADELVRGPLRFAKIDTQGSEWLALQGMGRLLAESREMALLIELWPYALRGATARELLEHLDALGFTLGKATEAPYPMTPERILAQVSRRDPVRGGIDLYGARGLPFHVLGPLARLHGFVRGLKEDR
jgi:FkbM family methyltransferase